MTACGIRCLTGAAIWVLYHLIAEGGAGEELLEVVEKMADEGEAFGGVAAGDVGREIDAGMAGEGMGIGQGLGVGDIEPGGGERAVIEGVEEGGLIDGGAAADVVEDGTGFAGLKAGGVEEMPCVGAVGEDVENMVGLAEGGLQVGVAVNHADIGAVGGGAAVGGDVQGVGTEEFDEAFADGAKAENEQVLAVEGHAVVAEVNPVLAGLHGAGAQGEGQLPGLGQEKGEEMIGAGAVEDVGAVAELNAFAGGGLAEVGRVVAGDAGTADLHQADCGGLQQIGGRGLAENDLGLEESGIRLTGRKYGGTAAAREAEVMFAGLAFEQIEGGFGKLKVYVDVHGGVGRIRQAVRHRRGSWHDRGRCGSSCRRAVR